MSKELGVFCGTFNPIHWGHLLMAEFARQQLSLHKVLFITSPNPPHRSYDLLDGRLRHQLVEAAVQGNPHFEASDLELKRSGPSYTAETLRQLHDIHPDARLNLIIGEDNLPYIARWHQAKKIFALARIVVAPRHKQLIKPTDPQESGVVPPEARTVMLDLPHVNVSSSQIRSLLRAGESVLYLVPPAVNTLLLEKRLFVETRVTEGT